MTGYAQVLARSALLPCFFLVVLCGACTRPAPPHREAQRFLDNMHLEQAMLAMADSLETVGKPAEAMRVLALLAKASAHPPHRQAVVARAKPLNDKLSDSELEDLTIHLADTPLAAQLHEELRRRGVVTASVPVRVPEPGHLGVLVPLTGRYARFGNAFLAGVRLAAETVTPLEGQIWRIMHEDTKGDVVEAALAARRLVETGGCQVLIGALLSTTTATTALVADRLGVPLVSPTATHERLYMLSNWVLQTNRTGPVEAEILARLACDVLLKKRFAIIRSDTPEGLDLAEAFVSSVARYGGTVIHEEVFDPAAIDFRPQLNRLRSARPEVVMAQASVDQMILLGPQLDFYRVGALVLGTSEWNSSRLLQHAGSVMDRAIFPASEVLYPAAWSASFEGEWPADQYDEEATGIARSAYLAARLVLEAMAETREGKASALIENLRTGFAGRSVDLDAAEAYSAAVRLIVNEQIVPFPGHLYAEALQRQVQALADATVEAKSDTTIGAAPYPSGYPPRP